MAVLIVGMKRRGGGKEIFLHQVELHKMVGHRFRGSSWRSGAWGVAALRKDDRDGGWAKVHHMVHLRPKSGVALRKNHLYTYNKFIICNVPGKLFQISHD